MLSDRIAGYADVVTHHQLTPSTPAQFLALAESGLARTLHVFWNPKLHWYDERVSKRWEPATPLAHLWAAFPLFEALDTVAIADPTSANRAAVNAFARGAERYFNAALEPVGGYAYYPGTTNPREHTFFDDNGWWELAYLDAYRATGSPRDLRDAERAFRFIAVSGWDHRSGGTWWETLHEHKTSEPLAAEIYAGFALYRATGDRSYLRTAETFLTWADRHSWNSAKQLYQRNATDPTVLDYVEGMMIGAQLELCEIRGSRPVHAGRAARPRLGRRIPALRRLDAGRGRRVPALPARPLSRGRQPGVVPDRLRERAACLAARALRGRPLLQGLGRRQVPGPPAPARRRHTRPVRTDRQLDAAAGAQPLDPPPNAAPTLIGWGGLPATLAIDSTGARCRELCRLCELCSGFPYPADGRSRLLVQSPGAGPTRIVAVDRVRVDAASLGDREGEELEADDVDDGMDGGDEGRLAAELAKRSNRIRGALGGPAFALEHVGAHALVDRGEVPVEQLLGVMRAGGRPRRPRAA